MRRLAVSAVAGVAITVVYACGGVGSTPDFNLNGDRPPSIWENPGAGEHPPNGGDPIGGCTCPTGRWKCGNITFSVAAPNGTCQVDPCSGSFTIKVDGQTITGTFKNQQLCVGQSCVSCVPDTGTGDDGGVTVDSGVKDAAKDVVTPKDSGTDVGTKVCVSTCEIDPDCQDSCPVIPNAIACCDQNTFACTFQSGSVCQ